jgi:hypothetical protein
MNQAQLTKVEIELIKQAGNDFEKAVKNPASTDAQRSKKQSKKLKGLFKILFNRN